MFTITGFGLFAAVLPGLSALTCGVLVLGGWRRRAHQMARQVDVAPQPVFDLGRAPFAGGDLDVVAEAHEVLSGLAGDAARDLVQLEFAAQPELSVHADRLALRTVLRELVSNGIRNAPGGRVLLTAVRFGGRVQFAVMDDGAGRAASVQEAALREIAQLVALQGGTMELDVHSGDGTTVVVRLPETSGAVRAAEDAPAQEPAQAAVVEHALHR